MVTKGDRLVTEVVTRLKNQPYGVGIDKAISAVESKLLPAPSFSSMSLYCPHCSRSIETHDGKPCPRQYSRRFFFGLMAGAGAAVVLPELPWWSKVSPDNGVSFRLGALRPTMMDLFDHQMNNATREQWARELGFDLRTSRPSPRQRVKHYSLPIPGTHRRIVGLEKP